MWKVRNNSADIFRNGATSLKKKNKNLGSRQMLQHENLLAKIGFHLAENETSITIFSYFILPRFWMNTYEYYSITRQGSWLSRLQSVWIDPLRRGRSRRRMRWSRSAGHLSSTDFRTCSGPERAGKKIYTYVFQTASNVGKQLARSGDFMKT